MPTFRGQAVRQGETPTARAIRERARARRAPRSITGMSAVNKAFPNNSRKQASVWAAIRKLRSNPNSDLYTMPKASFLAKFKNTHGIAYPYKVPK